MTEINKLAIDVAKVDTRLKGVEKKVDCLDELPAKITELLIAMERMTAKTGNWEKNIDDLLNRLDTLEKAPLGRMEKIKIAAIGSLVGSIIGVLVSAFTKILGG